MSDAWDAERLQARHQRIHDLRARGILLSTGRFDAGLGVLGAEPAERAAELNELGLPAPTLDAAITALEGSGGSRVINLATLVGILGAAAAPEALAPALDNARVTVYGTDGARGEVRPDALPVAEALRLKLAEHIICPAFFRAIAAAAVRALRARGFAVEAVPVGWDTRDLFAGEGKPGIFREAVVEGVLDAGADALVLGVTPIANTCYVLATLQSERPGVALGFNKTASHNPPSHDGIKSFCLDPASEPEAPFIRKLSPDEEAAITARFFLAALGRDPATERGRRLDFAQRARAVFAASLEAPENLGLGAGERWRARALVYDGSQGAASAEASRRAIERALRARAPEGAAVVLCACEPDGANINHRCGAGELEGLRELGAEDLAAAFADFASLQRVFEIGRRYREASRSDGRLVYGLATDGDSDRSYLFFYDPYRDALRFIDGDAAILLQARDGLESGVLGPGSRIAFTIESHATFINEALRRAQAAGAAGLRSYDDEAVAERLDLVMTPVGDKWVLATRPAIGGEATGHIIRAARIPTPAGERIIHAGNGVLGLFTTLSAVERRLGQAHASSDRDQAIPSLLDDLTRPYPPGPTLTSYVYFVERGRFYRGGPAWEASRALIEAALDRHLPGAERVAIDFAEDPNTLMMLLREGEDIVASVHVRCSGTEAKIGLKASAADRPELFAFLEALDEPFFALMNARLGDERSRDRRRQSRALTALASGPVAWDALTETLRENGAARDALFESQVGFLRSALRKQGLIADDGPRVQLTDRGRRAAKENP